MKKIVYLVSLLLTTTIISSFAQGTEIDIAVGYGFLGGNTNYRIGGEIIDSSNAKYKVHFPISKLEFPFNIWMLSLKEHITFTQKSKINVGLKKNIFKGTEKMKDSDWGYYYLEGESWARQNSLDIYSKSDAKLNALILDFDYQYKFFEKTHLSLSLDVGYIMQYFNYEIYNTYQWYPSYNDYYPYNDDYFDQGNPDKISGKTLTYEVQYHIPYMGLTFDHNLKDTFHIKTSLGYSPYVYVQDEDWHLRRDPLLFAKGVCDGYALLCSLEGLLSFPKNLFISFGFDYKKIKTDGRQKNYINGHQWIHTTDETIESDQIFIVLAGGYTFY